MFILKEAAITVVCLAISAPAFAGTVVTNSTTNRNSWGTGRSEFSSIRNASGTQSNYSQSLKMESLGDRAASSVIFQNGNFTGSATASTGRPVDPYSISSYASQKEQLSFTQNDTLKATEQYNFNGNEYSHSVSSDSSSF